MARGKWYSWYDGVYWTYPAEVDIDHVVALKEAWESGARNWSATNRQRFANDLGHPWTLDAVTDNVNASKGDDGPAEWLPPRAQAHHSTSGRADTTPQYAAASTPTAGQGGAVFR